MSEKIISSTTLELFPTRVWATQLPESTFAPINSSIRSLLDRMAARKQSLADTGQWQTGQNLHTAPELSGLIEVIGEFGRSICDSQTIVYDDIRVTGCWANVSRRGFSHPAHYHPNNFLSGAYYVNVDPGSDGIRFFDPRPHVNLIAPPARDPTKANPTQLTLHVKTGSLVMFPAWLTHSVDPNLSENIRISVAFNLMFPSFGTKMAGPDLDETKN